VKAELSNFLKKIADLGIEGSAKYTTREFQGVLQEDLVELLKDRSNCRLEVWKDLKDKLIPKPPDTAALVLSSLDSKDRLFTLDGHPLLTTKKGRPAVYAGGFKVLLTVAHNNKGEDTIIIHGLYLTVLDYQKGRNPQYAYKLDSTKIAPEGVATPHEFRVSVFGKRVGFATWIDPAGTPKKATSSNLFHTKPVRIYLLRRKTDDVENFLGTVLMQVTGTYTVAFQVKYSMGGKDYEAITRPVHVYFQDSSG